MRTVFNILATLKPKTGIGHYAAELFGALQRNHSDVGVQAFPSGALAGLVRRAHGTAKPGFGRGNQGIDSSELKTRLPKKKPGWLASAATAWLKHVARAVGSRCLGVAFRAACRRGAFDVYHEPNFIPFDCDLPTVVTVADLSVVMHPEWHPADRVRFHDRWFRHGLGADRHILTISEFIRKEVITHLGIASERVTAAQIGVGQQFFQVPVEQVERTRAALGLTGDYLLYVGTIEPRKNILTLLKAYCALPSELRSQCPLVLAGGWGWKADDVAEYYRTEAASRHVIHLGYAHDAQLPALYAGARALVFPSHYEGFGLPPLEMLAAGGAVIASTADAHREVLGSHAHYVEADDVDGWRDALSRAIREPEWLAEIRRGAVSRARRFSWERCAEITAAVYRRAAGRDDTLRRAA